MACAAIIKSIPPIGWLARSSAARICAYWWVAASGQGTGTDANVIQLSRGGVATGLVSIPLRYMHNPCELLALDDLDNTVALLTAFIESVKPDDDWTP